MRPIKPKADYSRPLHRQHRAADAGDQHLGAFGGGLPHLLRSGGIADLHPAAARSRSARPAHRCGRSAIRRGGSGSRHRSCREACGRTCTRPAPKRREEREQDQLHLPAHRGDRERGSGPRSKAAPPSQMKKKPGAQHLDPGEQSRQDQPMPELELVEPKSGHGLHLFQCGVQVCDRFTAPLLLRG